jgi:hypothetical protein
MTPMSINTAIDIAEGLIDPVDRPQWIQAWQVLIDSGVCWSRQGNFGRHERHLIRTGECRTKSGTDERVKDMFA